MARHGEVLIGCAGWSISSAAGARFPAAGSHLERYASVLPATYVRWRDSVPEHFLFSVKIPKEISHLRALRDCGPLLEKFIAEAGRLEQKLGCLLLQLPPKLGFDTEVVQGFLRELRACTDASVMCEPRHASWFAEEPAALLASFGIGYVEADPPVRPLPVQSGDVVYLRLHGSPRIYYSNYPPAFLDAISMRIAALRQEGKTVWCVFDNTAEGAALPNALYVLDSLR